MKKRIIIYSLIIAITGIVMYYIIHTGNNVVINHKSETIEIDLEKLETKDLLLTNGEPDSCYFVKLETTEECLVGHITKIIVCDTLLFIKDYNQKLFVFNTNGKFKNTIGVKGNASNELHSLFDFYINENKKQVSVFDAMKRKVFVYTYDGKLIKIKQCENIFMEESVDMFLMDNGLLLLTLSNSPDMKYNYIALNEKTYSVVENYFPYPIINKEYSRSTDVPKVASSNKQYFTPVFLSDTIYNFVNNAFHPAFFIKSNQKHLTSEIIKKYSTQGDLFETQKTLNEKGYSMGVSQVYATEDHILFYYLDNNCWYKIFWDLEKKRGYKTKV